MAKHILFILIALAMLFPEGVFAQKAKKVRPPKDPEWELMVTSDGVLVQRPTFMLENPKQSFHKWVHKHIKFPPQYPKPFYGTAVVKFVIDEQGNVNDVHLVRSTGNVDLDKAAVEAVAKSPAWEPLMSDGKPGKTQFTFPISFKIPAPTPPGQKKNSRAGR